MPVAKVQLIGGAFQDSEGNVLANGYLKMKLSQDSQVNDSEICSGIEITIQLDSNGNVASSSSTPPASNQFVWGNDQLSPTNSFYRVTGYKSNGQPAWGPNNQQVTGNGGTFDVGTWVPNSVFSWTPSLQIVVLETDGVINTVQNLLNLISGTGIQLSADGSGDVTISSSTGLNSQTGTSYTAQLSDNTKIVTMNNAGANTFTVPTNASVAFPIGATITVIQLGAGQTGLVAAIGVTLLTASSLTARAQNSTISVIKIATDTWVAAGDLT